MRRIALGIVLALAVAGCGSGDDTIDGSIGRAQDDTFLVQIVTPHDHYRSVDAIPITTTIMYVGPQVSISASGGNPGLIAFELEQLDGPLDMAGGVSRLMCDAHDLTAGFAYQVPYAKAGVFDENSANAGFWKAFYADKALHLPAGEWKITAAFRAVTSRDCTGVIHTLNPSVTFRVDG